MVESRWIKSAVGGAVQYLGHEHRHGEHGDDLHEAVDGAEQSDAVGALGVG